jgi:hypothetical protein
MDLTRILAQLRRERELVEEAIASLERLATGIGRPRRGRPPAWLQARMDRELKSPAQPPRVMKAGSTDD